MSLKGQDHSDFEGLYFVKEQIELGHVLLLNTNRKSNMESPTTPSHLTLVTLKGYSSCHSNFEGFYVVNGPR